MPADLDKLRKYNAAQRKNGNLRRVETYVDHQNALGILDIDAEAESVRDCLLHCENSLRLNSGIFDKIVEGAALDFGNIRRNRDEKIARMQCPVLLLRHESLH